MITPLLRIELLGGLRIWHQAQPVSQIRSPRLRSLLTYLLLHQHIPPTRQHLAFLFWPDSSETQARTNLRKLHSQLRQALPEADRYLWSDSHGIGWCNDGTAWLDVADLRHHLERLAQVQRRDETIPRSHLEAIASLYQGELLPSCYDEWIVPIRQQFHDASSQAIRLWVDRLAADGQIDIALHQARRLIELNPLEEADYRRLMELYIAAGDRTGALYIYERCVRVLGKELDVPPTWETRALYQRLRHSRAEAVQVEALAPTLLLDLLVSVAIMLIKLRHIEQAVSLLTLTCRHPMTPALRRQQAQDQLQALADQLPAPVWGAAVSSGNTMTVEEAVRNLEIFL